MYNALYDSQIELTDDHYEILLEIIEGFKELVDNRIYKYDIHSDNVMMTKDGTLKLIDYDMNYNEAKKLANIANKKKTLSSTIKI